MKKIICLLTILVCVVTLTACGDKQQAESSAVSEKSYTSVEEYLADPVIKELFDERKKENNDDIALEIKAEGNTLVYEYTYLKVHDKDYIKKESFDTATEDMRESMTALAKSLSDYIQADDVIVTARHISADGELLYEAEFSANNL